MNTVETTGKKILCVLLSVVMLVGMMPALAFAEETPPQSVRTAEEFAAMESGGDYILEADITVSSPYSSFGGTFDGNGHTITLAIESDSSNTGLFGTLTGGAEVKNLIVDGSVKSSENNTGAIAGMANTHDGAITVQNCKNLASIEGYKGVGGMIGICTGTNYGLTILACANEGDITGANVQVGGIAGNLEGPHEIKDCYNRGGVTGFNFYAGILGRGNKGVSVENCYASGAIAPYGTTTQVGYALVGGGSPSNAPCTIKNCYALEGIAASLAYTSGINAEDTAFKSESEMKSEDFADALGSNFVGGSGEYPTLFWEIPKAKVTFDVSPENAIITVNGAEYTGDSVVSLATGEYEYTVSLPGYVSQRETITVTDESGTPVADPSEVTVALSEDSAAWSLVTVNVTPQNAVLTVKDGETVISQQEATGATPGQYLYKLLKGHQYTYTASASGYGSESGILNFDQDEASKQIDLKKISKIEVQGAYKQEYYVGDSLDTEGLELLVTYEGGQTDTVTEGFEVSGFDSLSPAENQTLTVSYNGLETTFNISISEKPFPSSVFNGLAGKASVEYSHNSYFKGADGEEFVDDAEEGALRSNSSNMDRSTVTVTIRLNENIGKAKLSFDYRIESEGSYYVYDGLRINGGSKIGTTSGYVNYESVVEGGDEITLTYEKDYSGKSGADCVWFKNFALEELYQLSFDTAEGAEISVTDGKGDEVTAQNGVYFVSNGQYDYTISKFGYETATGKITVDGQDVKQTVELKELQKYQVIFDTVLPEGIDGECTYVIISGNSVLFSDGAGSYALPDGEYRYVINHERCESAEGTFTVNGGSIKIENALVRKTVFADFFAALSDAAIAYNCNEGGADADYGFEPGKEGENAVLISGNKKQSNSTAAMTIEAQSNIVLRFQYKVSSEPSYDKLTILLNGSMLAEKSGTVGWTDFETVMQPGDELVIKYAKDGSGDRNDDSAYLKSFEAEKTYIVSFDGLAGDAALTVTDGSGNILNASSGRNYILPDGDYGYSVTRYGYKTVSGSFSVSGSDQNISVPEMTAQPVHNISFSVTPEGASVEVSHKDKGTIEPEGGIYALPEGEDFKYSVSLDGYVSVSGSITPQEDKQITIELEYAGQPWDGTSKSEPDTAEDGTYLISNAGELAWFAEEAGVNTRIKGRLTANINLNGKTWEGFGEYDWQDDSSGFNGVLDGDGYTISGLVGRGGLLSCLGPDGEIRNMTVSGNISGEDNIGGIADTSKGLIQNCAFEGSVTNSASSGSTGGIAGRAMAGNKIISCTSSADISNTCTSYNSQLNMGGIAGYTYGTVESCYFTGTVSAREDRTNSGIAGIVGQLYQDGSISGTYSIGTVTGPENGTAAIAGKSSGTISNTYFLSVSGLKAVAENSGTDNSAAVTSETMKSGRFAYDLGEAYNQDTDGINSGYPVLKWQGGSEPEVPEFEQAIAKDIAALFMKDMHRAKELAAEKLLIDLEVESLGGLEAYREWFGSDLTMEDIYRNCGIDLEDDGTLTADRENKYQLKKEEAELYLPVEGEHGTAISWSSSDEDVIDPKTGEISLPPTGKAQVTLTATVSMGDYKDTRDFSFVIWSEDAVNEQTLSDIKSEAERTGTFIQPLQMYNHYNIKEAMEQYLERNGYSGITVELADAGHKVTPVDSKAYIAANGDISYFTGTGTGYGTTYAIYDDVTFVLELDGSRTEVSVRAHIGWDFDYVQGLLDDAMENVTWDSIKGANENASSLQEVDGQQHTVVEGPVAGELILPYGLQDYTYAQIKWSSEDADALYVTDNNDGFTYTATLERPAFGMEDNAFVLKGAAVFKFWDDYTIDEMTSLNGYQDPVESYKLFDITVPANDTDQSEEITAALDKYPSLISDFVNKDQSANLEALTADIQMPIPSALETNGIMTDRYYQKVTMTSSNEDVLEFNGYHGVVYRPLPGEEDVQVSYTVTISDRRNNATLGEKTFTLTVKAMEQSEIDEAASWMNRVCTEEVYWNGIKGSNMSKDSITDDLKPFVEVLDNNGQLQYIRGAINLTFGGIEIDDLPGYDPMHSQPWREFRSSRETVISSENLLVTKPEYNTDVTIDSVLTHSDYGKYWEKFGTDSRYAQFEQFYKRPVSVTVTVKGVNDMYDPNAEAPVKVTVNVKGNGYEDFADMTGYTYSALASDDKTAWDALEACLIAGGYKIDGSGAYISAVTDPNGVKLEEVEHGVYSGWLYTVNGQMPDKTLNQTYLKDGDVIEFYYSDGKALENQMAAEEVETLIQALPDVEELTLDDARQVIAARDGYNSLSGEQQSLVSAESREKLQKAEAKIAQLRQEIIAAFEDAYRLTGDHLADLIENSEAYGMEWMIMGLARADRSDDFDKDAYYRSIVDFVKENGSAQLSGTRSTENAKVVLALTSIGKDVTDVAGYNLLEPLADLDYLLKQGINGSIWALIAFDSHDYEIPALSDTAEGTQVTRENLIQTIISAQLTDGGFALSGNEADADMTAMAIQALAPYYDSNVQVKETVDKALSCLASLQNNDGSFSSDDITNAESCAQVIVALTALGIDPADDVRFIKNGYTVIDALLGFYVEGEGFMHTAGSETDPMATEQSYYSLAAYSRFLTGKTSLYDMSDVTIKQETEIIEPEDPSVVVPGDDTDKPESGTEIGKDDDVQIVDVEKTGDSNSILLWIAIAACAAGAGGGAYYYRRKSKRKDAA